MGNPAAIALGPGNLKWALLGTTEPADLVSAWPTGWVDLGYTNEGHIVRYQLNVDPVEVEEELDPVSYTPTGRTLGATFSLAELTASNLQRAFNGGTIVSGSGFVYIEPPGLGAEQRYMYGWQSTDTQERWIIRKALNSGTVEIPRRKGANKAVIAFEINAEIPSAGISPYRHYFVSPGRA